MLLLLFTTVTVDITAVNVGGLPSLSVTTTAILPQVELEWLISTISVLYPLRWLQSCN